MVLTLGAHLQLLAAHLGPRGDDGSYFFPRLHRGPLV